MHYFFLWFNYQEKQKKKIKKIKKVLTGWGESAILIIERKTS